MDKAKLMNILKVINEGNITELNHIPYEVRNEYLVFAQKEGLINGLESTKDGLVGKPKITLKGIDYYEENKKSTKLYRTLKEIRDWIPGY